jgi:hypothetical protein
MLRADCRRFRAELAPDDPHRRTCPACAAYAAALERAARKVPLPARLRSRLRSIPGDIGDIGGMSPGPRLPLPQAPMPDPLRDRLRGLARRPEPRPLPAWVRTSRYAVAASYLMAVLLSFTVGNPLHLGRQAAGLMSHAVSERLAEGRERLDILEDTVLERYGETRRSLADTLEDSLGNLGHRVGELSQSLRTLEPLIPRRMR